MNYNFDEIIDRKNTNSENVDGWRPYIFKCGPEKVFPYADDEFIRMWVADMEFAVAPEIRQAIIGRVDRKILGYTIVSDQGYYDALLKWCNDRYDWTFEKEELVFSPGVIPALYQLVEDLVAKDEKVLTMTPAYGFFLHACEYNGVELVKSPLKKSEGRFEIDFEDFAQKAADPKVRLLMLCNPHNPSGRIWTRQELEKIADIAAKNDLWIVSDEIHCDLIRTGLSHIPMGKIMPEYKKLITTISASKTFNLAGLQVSNIFVPDQKLRRAMRRAIDQTGYGNLNMMGLAACQAAYEKGEEWLQDLKRYLTDNLMYLRQRIKEDLPGIRLIEPEGTYLVWLDLRELDLSEEEQRKLIVDDAGLWLDTGTMFGAEGAGFERINIACPRSTLKEAMDRLARALQKKGEV